MSTLSQNNQALMCTLKLTNPATAPIGMTSQRMTSILSYNGQVLKKVRETNCFTHLNNNRHAYI